MSSERLPDKPGPQSGAAQGCTDKEPQVVIRIRPTETADSTRKDPTHADLLGALNALEAYPGGDSNSKVTRCGGRTFQTPVFGSLEEDPALSGLTERNGEENCLSKTNLAKQQSVIIEALTRWVNAGGKDDAQQDLQRVNPDSKTSSPWSVWISKHLYADLNLALDERVIHYDSIQVFFIGEDHPTFILALYDVPKSTEYASTRIGKDVSSNTTVKGEPEASGTSAMVEVKPEPSGTAVAVKEKTPTAEPVKTAERSSDDSARKFALQLAKELTVELHRFCSVDFLILPCVLTYDAFIEDLLQSDHSTAGSALWRQIQQEQRKAQWYYSGPLQLSHIGYREVKEAASMAANVSYVPYITSSDEEKRKKKWLVKFPPTWRRALSLLVEALGSTEDVTFTLTCSKDQYPTIEMTVLEAARRWAFSHDVILHVPNDSLIKKDETQKDFLRLTGKRKHPCYKMKFQNTHDLARQELVYGRNRGQKEIAHLLKHEKPVRRVIISKVQREDCDLDVVAEDDEEEDEDDVSDEETPPEPLLCLPQSTVDEKISGWLGPTPSVPEHQDLPTKDDHVTQLGIRKTDAYAVASDVENQSELLAAAAKVTQYSQEKYEETLTDVGQKAPVLQNRTSKGLLKRRHNQLKKTSTVQYERTIFDVVLKCAESTKIKLWMSPHLHVDFSLPLEVNTTDNDYLQVFIVGVNLPPIILTLYDLHSSTQSTVSKAGKTSTSSSWEQFTLKLSDNLTQILSNACGQEVTTLPCSMSMQEFEAGTLCERVKKRQDLVKLFDEKDYRHTARVTETLFACTALPSFLSKNTKAEKESQKWFTLMESAWRDDLSLMIEALSFQHGDCYIPYTEDTEFKVKVAALEAARRWSLSHNVAVVSDDACNPDITAQKSILEAPMDIGLMRLTVTNQEEEKSMPEKRILLDTSDIPEKQQSMYFTKVDEARGRGDASTVFSDVSSLSVGEHVDETADSGFTSAGLGSVSSEARKTELGISLRPGSSINSEDNIGVKEVHVKSSPSNTQTADSGFSSAGLGSVSSESRKTEEEISLATDLGRLDTEDSNEVKAEHVISSPSNTQTADSGFTSAGLGSVSSEARKTETADSGFSSAGLGSVSSEPRKTEVRRLFIGEVQMKDNECPKCSARFVTPVTGYTLFPDIVIEDLLKKENTQQLAFKKLFCALLNRQETNFVIFHVEDCRIIDLYDSKVGYWLNALIPDGSPYEDRIEREVIDANHFQVCVKPSKGNPPRIMSTVDFHTCFSLDRGLDRRPTHTQMQRFLEKIQSAHTSKKGPTSDIRDFPSETDFIFNKELLINGKIPFQESMYLQAKGIEPRNAHHIDPRHWKEQVGGYISAFAKVEGGGSLYFGVNEERKSRILTKFVCKGVNLGEEEKENWRRYCSELVNKMLWVAPKQVTENPQIRLDFITLKDDPHQRCCIQVSMEEFKGIVFLRKEGPESYDLDANGEPIEIPWIDWMKRCHCDDFVEVAPAPVVCSYSK